MIGFEGSRPLDWYALTSLVRETTQFGESFAFMTSWWNINFGIDCFQNSGKLAPNFLECLQRKQRPPYFEIFYIIFSLDPPAFYSVSWIQVTMETYLQSGLVGNLMNWLYYYYLNSLLDLTWMYYCLGYRLHLPPIGKRRNWLFVDFDIHASHPNLVGCALRFEINK